MEFGATATVDPKEYEDIASRFAEMTGGAPDIILDCVGVLGTLQSAIDIAPARATIVVVGVCMKPDEILPLAAALKELRIQFVMAYSDKDFARVIDLINAGRVRSEEHTSELQSHHDLVCRLLLEKKKQTYTILKQQTLQVQNCE